MAFLDLVKEHGVVAIVRGIAPEYMMDLAQALHRGGICLLECTFNQKDPDSWKGTLDSIAKVGKAFGDSMVVGAGTVLSLDQLHMTLDAGGKFFVSPNVDVKVIGDAKRLGMGALPGIMTPSEAVMAHDAGADAVKLFPAGNLGPGYLKAMRAPLSHIDFLAVGGVDEKNVAEYIRAGAIGAGVGGNLAKKALIEAGKFDEIEACARALVEAVKSAK